jgi:AraC-like DNA-binding protein
VSLFDALEARRLRRELNKQAGIVGGVDEQHVVGRAGMTVFVGDVGSGTGELGSGNVRSRAVVGAVVVSGSWRPETAQGLLYRGVSVSEAAETVGMAPADFSRVYKAWFGYPPSREERTRGGSATLNEPKGDR